MTFLRRTWWTPLVLTAIVGCNEESTPVDTPPPSSSAVSTPDATTPASGGMSAEMQPAPTPAGDAVSFSDVELAAIKKLPADEQTLAMKQGVCPVSEGKLGSMGKPFKVTAKGQTLFLCCDGCKADVESDPDAVLAKLKK